MLFLKSLLFNFLVYFTTLIQMIIFAPSYFMGDRANAWRVPKRWAKINFWLHEKIIGTTHEVTGLENIPDGPYILAPKHQSMWDTYAFLPHVRDAVLILKRSLMRIPMFGQYVAHMKMIPIDRGSREQAREQVLTGAIAAFADNRELLIYPEGTRRVPGAEPAYKKGIAHIYVKANVPVVAVAHNAGLFWPRNSFLRYPGKIRVHFLKPIQPGLSANNFMQRLIRETEDACDLFLLEAARSDNPPPLPEEAKKRIAELEAKGL